MVKYLTYKVDPPTSVPPSLSLCRVATSRIGWQHEEGRESQCEMTYLSTRWEKEEERHTQLQMDWARDHAKAMDMNHPANPVSREVFDKDGWKHYLRNCAAINKVVTGSEYGTVSPNT